MTNTRRYTFRLYPTAEQAELLHVQRKMMADLWNALKQRMEDRYRRERKSLSFFDLTNEITELRHECPEWAALPAITSHRVAKRLVDAYSAFYRRVAAGDEPGYPRWQRRENGTSIPLGTMLTTGWRLQRDGDNPLSWRLHYGGVTDVRDLAGWIRARGCIPAAGRDHRAAPQSRRRYRATHPIDVNRWRNGDIMWRDGKWWLSVCVDIGTRRVGGRSEIAIRFDLIDCFALVDGYPETPDGMLSAEIIQEDADRLKSERDVRWPRGRRRSDDEQQEFRDAGERISRLMALAARKRANALHVWSSRLVERAASLTIVAPASVKGVTKTPRGDKKRWGAQVDIVSDLNRHVLSQSPATAVAMLRYKAEEAGIRCDVITASHVDVGAELVSVGRQVRQSRRDVRRAA